MGGRGRDAAHMAKARAKRAPFTDPRDGRVKSQIRFAFFLSRGKPLTTSQLLKSCIARYPSSARSFRAGIALMSAGLPTRLLSGWGAHRAGGAQSCGDHGLS